MINLQVCNMISIDSLLDCSGNIAIVTKGEPYCVIDSIIDGLIAVKEKRNLNFLIILVGSDKLSTYVSARINGFTFIDTYYSSIDHRLYTVSETPYSNRRSHIRCYAEQLPEGKLSILKYESVGLVISKYGINSAPDSIEIIAPVECLDVTSRLLKE